MPNAFTASMQRDGQLGKVIQECVQEILTERAAEHPPTEDGAETVQEIHSAFADIFRGQNDLLAGDDLTVYGNDRVQARASAVLLDDLEHTSQVLHPPPVPKKTLQESLPMPPPGRRLPYLNDDCLVLKDVGDAREIIRETTASVPFDALSPLHTDPSWLFPAALSGRQRARGLRDVELGGASKLILGDWQVGGDLTTSVWPGRLLGGSTLNAAMGSTRRSASVGGDALHRLRRSQTNDSRAVSSEAGTFVSGSPSATPSAALFRHNVGLRGSNSAAPLPPITRSTSGLSREPSASMAGYGTLPQQAHSQSPMPLLRSLLESHTQSQSQSQSQMAATQPVEGKSTARPKKKKRAAGF